MSQSIPLLQPKSMDVNEGIPVTVVDVHPFANYNTSQINKTSSKSEFRYENPLVFLELSSDIGTLMVSFSFNTTPADEVFDILRASDDGTFSGLFEEELYIYTGGSLSNNRAEIGLSSQQNKSGELYKEFEVQQTDTVPVHTYDPTSDRESGRPEERQLKWLDAITKVFMNQYILESAWVEREINAVTYNNECIQLEVSVTEELTAVWEFTDGLGGRLEYRDFTNKHNLPISKNEIEGSKVFIQPVFNTSLSNGDSIYNYKTDTLERLIIDTPNNEKPSLSERISNFLSKDIQFNHKPYYGGSRTTTVKSRRGYSSIEYEKNDPLKENM